MAVAVLVLLVGAVFVRNLIFTTMDRSLDLRSAEGRTLALRLQLDDETYLRNFAATGDASYLGALAQTMVRADAVAAELLGGLAGRGLPRASAAARAPSRPITPAGTCWSNPSCATPRAAAHRALGAVNGLDGHLRADGAAVNRLSIDTVLAAARTRRAVNRTMVLAAFGSLALLALAVYSDGLRAAYVLEKRVSSVLQRAFAGNALPELPSLHFAARTLGAGSDARAGGDWHDAYEFPGGRVFFAIGDIAGHGIDAAVAMSRARQSMIAAALSDDDPASVLSKVNAAILLQGGGMATALCGYVDAASGAVRYASAGHPPPTLAAAGAVRMLPYGALPLGVMADAAYETRTVSVSAGALLVLYTDGVLEHRRDVVAGEVALLEAVRTVTAADSRPGGRHHAAGIRAQHGERRHHAADRAVHVSDVRAAERLARGNQAAWLSRSPCSAAAVRSLIPAARPAGI